MPEKLEEIMKKIYVLLANCEQIAYSSDDVIVPKKKLFALLEQLNYVIYEIMEQYEMTLAARNRAILQEEQKAREIQKNAKRNAEDMYAASLVYTEDILNDLKIVTDIMYQKIKTEYEEVLQNHTKRMKYLRKTEDELLLQLNAMADSKMYVRIIEERRKEKEVAIEREKEERKKTAEEQLAMLESEKAALEKERAMLESEKVALESKRIALEGEQVEDEKQELEPKEEIKAEPKQQEELKQSEESKQIAAEEKRIEKPKKRKQSPAQQKECVGEVIEEEIDEYAAKLSSQLVITVHERPQVPEGFTKKKDKRAVKIKPEVPDEEIEISPDEIVDYNEIPQFSAEDLDKEYFEWQESKERTGEKITRGKVKGQKLLARWKK